MSSNIFANVVIQGSITALGTYGQTTYAPVDLGINSLSLASGNLTSLITTTSSAPTGFAAAGEGALVFPGTANAYISFGTTGQPFSNSNIYSFGDFVVEAWVNPSNFTNAPVLFGYGDPTNQNNLSWYFEIATNGQLQWYSTLNGALSGVQTNTSLVVGTWVHIASIHQSGTKRLQIYINGQPQTFASTSGGFSASGTVATYTTGVIASSAYQVVIGQLYNSTYAYNGSLTNLRIVTGSGAAQIYNNNAFTPSTSPLFPASNTAGGSLTTRLLVRAPLTKGQTNISKIGPASGVLAFPPAPMSSYATNLTGQSYYGQGTYVASASSELSGSPSWQAFDKNNSTSFYTGTGTYNVSTGVVATTTTTVDVAGNSYLGEWLQVQMPSSIVITSYSVSNAGGYAGKWWILGSRDGTNWYLVDQRNVTAGQSGFSVGASQAFTYFRFVVYSLYPAVTQYLGVVEWTLNGSIESVNVTADGRVGLGVVNPTRALEVAGDIVCTGTVSSGTGFMFRNALYNGDMRVAQRGTSFTSFGGSNGGSSALYTLDRWTMSQYGGAGNGSVSQIQSGLANFSNALQLVTTSTTAGNWWLTQSLETRDVVRFQGQPVTVSFWYRVTSNFTNQWVPYIYWSTTADVRLADGYNNGTPSPTQIAGPTLTNQTAWTYASFTGFIPSTAQSLAVNFTTTNNTVNGATIQITGVQLEKGSVATPFEVRPYATELALCQRYYQKTYNMGTAPGTNVSGVGAIYTIANGTNEVLGSRFVATMRATPAVTMYNPYSTTTTGVIGVGSTGLDTAAATASTIGEMGFRLVSSSGLTSGVTYQYHYTANAEL